MTSSPGTFGRPRSITATSTGYSRPQYRPSSPSAAASTLKPASCNCWTTESRKGFSSSTMSTRMGSLHGSGFGVDAHRPDLSFGAEQPDLVDAPVSHAHGLGPHGLGVIAALRHLHGLIEGDLGRLDAVLLARPAVNQLLRVAHRSARREQGKQRDHE